MDEGFQVDPISPITPRAGVEEEGEGEEDGVQKGEEEKKKFKMAAERFEDTWTKLAVFGLDEYEVSLLSFPSYFLGFPFPGSTIDPLPRNHQDLGQCGEAGHGTMILSPHIVDSRDPYHRISP